MRKSALFIEGDRGIVALGQKSDRAELIVAGVPSNNIDQIVAVTFPLLVRKNKKLFDRESVISASDNLSAKNRADEDVVLIRAKPDRSRHFV